MLEVYGVASQTKRQRQAGIFSFVQAHSFPTTHATWIDDAIESQRHGALRDYFLTRYREPLLALLRVHAPALTHDAEEIVHAFLFRAFGSSPKAAAEYAAQARASGMRMRRYVANGMLFHARGVLRDRTRMDGRITRLPDLEEFPQSALSMAADEAFERAWAQSIVREACLRVESALQASTRGRMNIAWELFRRHALDGRRYSELVEEFRLDEQQMADLVRSVVRRLRDEIERTLELEGVPTPEISSEIDRLLERLGS